MEEKLSNFFVKFADNAHLGKIATELAPGIVLTITILLVLNSFTGLEIFPYTKRNKYQKSLQQAREESAEADSVLRKLCANFDTLDVSLEVDGFSNGEKLKKLAERELLRKALERLMLKSEEKKKRLDTLEIEEEQAPSLKKNLEVFTDHFMVLFIAGYFLGAILAQVSGKLFYNGYFHRHFKKRYRSVYDVLYRKDQRTITYFQLQTPEEFLNRLPNLESDYYRYLEIAMNMILPWAALTLALATIAWQAEHSKMLAIFATASLLINIGLYYNARVLYVGYFLKKADVMKSVLERTGATPDPIA